MDTECGAAYAPIGSFVGERCGYVLDADLNPLPAGVAGELYLGGVGLARGYLQRPGLSAERFVANPFSRAGERLYRTGDLVRQREDGTFDYLGRIDNQVKVRGFRIELGEIEARLQDAGEVREAVVVARDAASGKQLLGYVVAEDGADASGLLERLRERLQRDLPEYMVPAHLALLPAMPLTPNGKIDRRRCRTSTSPPARPTWRRAMSWSWPWLVSGRKCSVSQGSVCTTTSSNWVATLSSACRWWPRPVP